ncbi:uncharacterized protein BDZ83DRAFT_178309 [Colletotrichum acutatum]|uniref:Uncharacterized protein n=1 Tax=Glomerella acutata TaxID=27357 RepID=A0AAD8UUC3_GLOAC|nr:uncharacterized protein BDZ83DRAFT_178309 [Colletotrichum acutatum]KAK1727849.1 hypothetical protein BDZ83DRAFT_178309 [Colletotrichum acutatum]
MDKLEQHAGAASQWPTLICFVSCLATFTPSSPPNTTLPPHHHFLTNLGRFAFFWRLLLSSLLTTCPIDDEDRVLRTHKILVTDHSCLL